MQGVVSQRAVTGCVFSFNFSFKARGNHKGSGLPRQLGGGVG